MSDQQPDQTQLLREILKWIRFAGMKEVKDALGAALDTDQKRLIYQLSDGKHSSVELSKVAGISDWTVRNYWKGWARIGIVEALKAGRGDRYKRSFDLEDFGIETPKAPSVGPVKSQPTQEILSVDGGRDHQEV